MASTLFDQFGLAETVHSINRTLQQWNAALDLQPNRVASINRLIEEFGADVPKNAIEADITARVLIEQKAISLRDNTDFNVDTAVKQARAKIASLVAKHPSMFVVDGVMVVEAPQPQKKVARQGGAKKEMARLIFEREAGKSNCDIAKIIAKELKITFANAYYYTTRAFK